MNIFGALLVFTIYNLVLIPISAVKTNSRLMDRGFRSYRQSADKKLDVYQEMHYMPSANFLHRQKGSLRPNVAFTDRDQSSLPKNRNLNKLLIAFDNQCINSSNAQNEIENYINEITSIYSCLNQDLKRKRNIYHNTLVDEWHAFLKIDYNAYDNTDGSSIDSEDDCLNENEIDYDDYCISYIDYEFIFEYQSRNELECVTDTTISSDPYSNVNRWHLTSIDGSVDSYYTHVDTAS